MVRSLLRKMKALRLYNAGERAIIEKRLTDAVTTLEQIDFPPLYQAKARLLMATALHKQKLYDDAEAAYRGFSEHFVESIKHDGDRVYLREYADFFADVLKRKRGRGGDAPMDPSRLKNLSAQASMATRGEFPPADPG